jgi:hypothetical protein
MTWKVLSGREIQVDGWTKIEGTDGGGDDRLRLPTAALERIVRLIILARP